MKCFVQGVEMPSLKVRLLFFFFFLGGGVICWG